MKTRDSQLFRTGSTLIAIASLFSQAVVAQIGGSGRDGAFVPTVNQTLDTTANNGVFEFTSIAIPVGVTVTLIGPNPAVLRSQGPVTIAGTLQADGSLSSQALTVPGPGGYPGGHGGVPHGDGQMGGGPGGGYPTLYFISPTFGGSGSHATPGTGGGAAPGALYGTAFPFDLRGGSGGGGGGGTQSSGGFPGCGGGGTIAILTDAAMTVNGTVSARGGAWLFPDAPGSGGSVLLRALGGVQVTGSIAAIGGAVGSQVGGDGFVRIDAYGAAPAVTGAVSPAPAAQSLPFVRAANAPYRGGVWRLEAYTGPGSLVGWFLATNAGNTSLPPFGVLLLDQAGIAVLGFTAAQTTALDDVATCAVPVPNDPALLYLPVFLQVLDFGGPTLAPRLSNAIHDSVH